MSICIFISTECYERRPLLSYFIPKLTFFKAPTPFENPKTQQRFEDPS